MNRYVLCYDLQVHSIPSNLLDSFISNHRLVQKWSSPFPGVYFLYSDEDDAEKLSDSIEDFFSKRSFFVAKIGPTSTDTNGRINVEFWKFINPDANQD
jgi:hypothetical protein